jgi:hypothetical protein
MIAQYHFKGKLPSHYRPYITLKRDEFMAGAHPSILSEVAAPTLLVFPGSVGYDDCGPCSIT